MKPLLAILALLPALVSAQPAPAVDPHWLSPRRAEVAWSGPGGPGVCVWRIRQYYHDRVFAETCAAPGGVLAVGNDAEEGDRFELRGLNGVTVLASAELGEAPRYELWFPLFVAP